MLGLISQFLPIVGKLIPDRNLEVKRDIASIRNQQDLRDTIVDLAKLTPKTSYARVINSLLFPISVLAVFVVFGPVIYLTFFDQEAALVIISVMDSWPEIMTWTWMSMLGAIFGKRAFDKHNDRQLHKQNLDMAEKMIAKRDTSRRDSKSHNALSKSQLDEIIDNG